jgi:phosphatidylglycerol:prolipoprotein diacylglycerol transferase
MQRLVWDIDPEIFALGPFQPRWYGLLFALGFFLGYEIMSQFYRREGRNLKNLSDLFLHLLLGAIIGARLGHVFLYQPDYYLAHPWEIPMIWQGGLASHGGFAGIIISVYLYLKRYQDMSLLELADRLAIPSLLAATLIRIGNFFNSEILGTPSNLPWAIVFARIDNIPRHPAMLYEAVAYFFVFCTLYVAYWKTTIIHFPGRVFGATLVTCFLARFMIEFVKEIQVSFEKLLVLNIGQLLSIPFIVVGAYLLYSSSKTT